MTLIRGLYTGYIHSMLDPPYFAAGVLYPNPPSCRLVVLVHHVQSSYRGRPPRIHSAIATPLEAATCPRHASPPNTCVSVSVCASMPSPPNAYARPPYRIREAAAYQDAHKGNAYGVTDHGGISHGIRQRGGCRTRTGVAHGTPRRMGRVRIILKCLSAFSHDVGRPYGQKPGSHDHVSRL